MTANTPKKNIPASIRARLLNEATRQRIDFQRLLTRYMHERLMYRIGISPYRNQLVLKGAWMFVVLLGKEMRPTKDTDFLGYGPSTPSDVAQMFHSIVTSEVSEDDGVRFDPKGITADEIRNEARYGGVRLKIPANLDTARQNLQIDVGFGDAVQPRDAKFPVLLKDISAPDLRIYSADAIVAEKLEAIVLLGEATSRMKDFYDLFVLAEEWEFDAVDLVAAIRATFTRRQTWLPMGTPPSLTDFPTLADKRTQWLAFRRKQKLPSHELGDVCATITTLVTMPIKAAATHANVSGLRWMPKIGWTGNQSQGDPHPMFEHWRIHGPRKRGSDDRIDFGARHQRLPQREVFGGEEAEYVERFCREILDGDSSRRLQRPLTLDERIDAMQSWLGGFFYLS